MAALDAYLKPAQGGFRNLDLRVTALSFTAFVCGAAGIKLNFLGEIYLTEILVIQFAFMLMVFGRDRQLLQTPVFGLFLQVAVVMLAGYIISDLYRESDPWQFLRGWARVIVLTLDIAAVAVLVSRDSRNLWWFVLGIGLGNFLNLQAKGLSVLDPYWWKFGFSTAVSYLLGAAAYVMPLKVVSLAFAGLGIFNFYMDFRIMGAINLMVGAILWVRSGAPDGLDRYQTLKLVAACMIAFMVIAIALTATQAEFASRREGSNVGRVAGLSVSAWAIAESPVLGWGSWPTDPRLVSLFTEEIADEGVHTGVSGVFAAHSQVLQAWVEGGILAAIFWFVYGYWLLKTMSYTVLRRQLDAYTPIFLFILFYDFWEMLMSPFSSPTRIPISLGIGIIILCAMEQRRREAATLALPQSQGAALRPPPRGVTAKKAAAPSNGGTQMTNR